MTNTNERTLELRIASTTGDLSGEMIAELLELMGPTLKKAGFKEGDLELLVPNLKKRPVAFLCLSVRTKNMLERIGVKTVGELVAFSKVGLAAKNDYFFDNDVIKEINDGLQPFGLSLSEDQ